ncbi:MAG: hypothetical protein Q4E10_00400 [Porphyromonas sp.]|nr:hypothetical protein [Porphyromonas sp.]
MKRSEISLGAVLREYGPSIVIAGAILYGFDLTRTVAGWVMAGGALVSVIGLMITSVSDKKAASQRVRRLDRMTLLGLLLFLVSGGVMIQGSNNWVVLFAIATVFYLYGSLMKIRELRKEERR